MTGQLSDLRGSWTVREESGEMIISFLSPLGRDSASEKHWPRYLSYCQYTGFHQKMVDLFSGLILGTAYLFTVKLFFIDSAVSVLHIAQCIIIICF